MKNKNKFGAKGAIFAVVLPVLAIACILCACALCFIFRPLALIIAAVTAFLYFNTALVAIILTAVFSRGKKEHKIKKGPVLGNIMYDKINFAKEPAFICDQNHKIVWANRFANDSLGQKKVLGVNINSIFPYEFESENVIKKHKNVRVNLNGETYLVEETKINALDEVYYLLFLRNLTVQAELEQLQRDKEKIVAYVMVDNLDSLLQYEQENYRETAAKVEKIVRSWAESVNGIIKEYEKDKYIAIFNMEDLDKFIRDNFSLLDKVRDIRFRSGSVPVTLSIGVAKNASASLAEKEKLAQAALDMALQRGGDQAVVKIEDEVLFFGGRTNAVHRRNKVRARVVATELVYRMKQASNVIVMGHANPDYDAIGASIGIARIAKHSGAKVNIVTNFKDINVKKMLAHFEGLEEYRNVFVDSSKGLDLVKADTLLIIVDVNNAVMFESSDIAKVVENVIIIDHHRQTAEFEREPIISYIETSASSTCEIVAELVEQALYLDAPLAEEANALYAGILLDTKHFTKGTGTKTHAAAMYLKDNGAKYEIIQDLFKTTIVDYRKESAFGGEHLQIYRNCMAIAFNANGKDNSDRIMAAKVADNLLGVEGVHASFVLLQIGNVVHVSARSNGTINVQLILEKLHGGGRYDAAGAQVKNSNVNDVLLAVKAAIDEYINPEV